MEGGAMSAPAGMQSCPLEPLPQPGDGLRLAYAHDGTASYKHAPKATPAYEPPQACSAPRARPEGGNGAAPAPPKSASAEPPRKKRGHPRKYAPNGTMPLAILPAQQPAGTVTAVPPGFSAGLGGVAVVNSETPLALPPPLQPAPSVDATPRVRGRPPGSRSKKPRRVAAAGSGVAGLYPQVITVQAGEDLATKVMSFSGNGWAVCILSANGAVSNVTLRHAASSRETVIYEGCFEILSLSGWYLPSESNGLNSRTGGINISLAGPNGRVLGGGVAGPLTAASPVQVVIGSFLADNKKEHKQAMNNGIPGAGSSPSRGALSGSSGGPGTPPNQNAAGSFNTISHPVLSNFPWK